ncbi:hypothetical protein FB565_008614 [Actinoplanes lutulentus]|uniref:Uncharacterized protein n=1 Tax=Actinoplanes lutulentus TaxID=1287878 RepID=A0A327Z335_9ACTN|nr:hypothetical protein [Actinoplanes lutulentus]MBB2948828.1 hypothetical protein [Actinoplanes lutulentus]RAK29739.1 hypothetical protein B0I29_11765 [Actinoplanes lutulentus]
MRMARLVMAVLAALTVFAVPAAAQAASGPEIQYATSEYEGNTGVLLVGIRSVDGVSAVHADVKDGTGNVIASSDSFWRYRGEQEDETQVWATQEPFILPQMGYYPVDVEVTDTNGVTTSVTDAGQLAYVVVTFIDSVTVKPATATYEKRSVSVTGVLKGRQPGTMEIRRVADAPVSLLSNDWQETTTGADGRFTAAVPIVDGDRNIAINYSYDQAHPYNMSSSYDTPVVTIKPRATKVTATVSAKKVKAGEPITVSGTATWNTPDGWVPVSTGQVNLLACDTQDSCDYLDGAPVAADGTYTLTATPYQSTTVRVSYSAPARPDGYPDPYVARSQRDVTVVVLQPSSVSDFTASREASGAVHLHGHVQFPGSLTPGTIPVEFQFSETGTGDWLAIGDDDQSYWDGTGYEFESRLTESRSGWWRARYPGDPASFQAAVSKKIFVP